MSKRVVAVDLGATSGRVMAAVVGVDPGVLDLVEVHRFPNGGVRAADGSLRWDIRRIHGEVLEGIRLAAASGPVDAIGIDSWAIDYGLLDGDGHLIGDPYSYRDSRTDGVAARVVAELGDDILYQETGLQQLPFSTLFQLVAARESATGSEELRRAATMLLIPDLLGFWLTGQARAERTNASTTQFYSVHSHEWSTRVLERVGLPEAILPGLHSPGDTVGTLLPDVAQRVGLPPDVPVIAVGSHDTASAVVGVPADEEPFAYVSSGTWSLVGLELPDPVLTDAARRADFTNEAGVDGTIRFLKNVTGLWVLSECVRDWAQEGVAGADLATVLGEAALLPAGRVVDVDDPRLLPPDGMPARVIDLVHEIEPTFAGSPAEITRVVLDSLALAYRRCVRTAAALAGVQPERVHVVGGGSENHLLCQLTADTCRLPVIAGPKEAAALGNVLVQARALGVGLHTVADMRALLRATQVLRRFEPDPTVDWARLESRLELGEPLESATETASSRGPQ